ncbi:MAG: response regulator transcription factor, partial [Bacteroidia bacterium]|nr:response regulator transcription factor [Bacteroidia bacterium]
MKTIKIALVDDHEIVRMGIGLVLSKTENFKVVFDSASGNEFLDYLRSGTHPDVVLMDINMPGIDGIETTVRALKMAPDLGIIALTAHSDIGSLLQMEAAGARGFVHKGAKKEELEEAILQICGGGYRRRGADPPIRRSPRETGAEDRLALGYPLLPHDAARPAD